MQVKRKNSESKFQILVPKTDLYTSISIVSPVTVIPVASLKKKIEYQVKNVTFKASLKIFSSEIFRSNSFINELGTKANST
jgi:hypothetical protein